VTIRGGLLHDISEKIARFNRIRLETAQILMEKDEKYVFQTFPLLFHFNHPSLPGYIDQDVPAGICKFEPSDYLKQLSHDFLKVDLSTERVKKREILALYAMGSTSSVGQSSESDFDIWICHSNSLSSERLQYLTKKSWAISAWAETLGVELNFFLVADNKFILKNQSKMSNDDCGSTQHLLLLDEFYRTAIRVAGKPLLWLHVPPEEDKNYNKYVKYLVDNHKILLDDWIDFGPLYEIPAEEYFGATLWQIYKGLDSPHKSILKMTLMEAYSWEYPNTELLSTVYKKKLYQLNYYDQNLDPYCIMLDKVTHYLTQKNELKRLALVRSSFYLKTEEHLSKVCDNDNTAWRRTILNNYINSWEWPSSIIVHLDNRDHWKAATVQQAKKELFQAFMTSYQQLLSFARKSNISESISAKDIGILSRKLYTAYEDQPGKIELINPRISSNLSEPNLSFIQVPKGRTSKAGWYLYNSSLEMFNLVSTPYLLYAGYLSKLIAWCYINGLYEEETKLYLYNQGSDLLESKLNQFIQDLYSIFPMYTPKATNKELIQPCEIKHLAIFLNVEKDPTQHWKDFLQDEMKEGMFDDIFSYGDKNESLIGSIDLVYRNSWNEVRTLHFNDRYSVVDALNTILGKMHQFAKKPEQLDVFSYSRHFQSELESAFKNIIRKYINIRLSANVERTVETLYSEGQKFAFYFERTGVSLHSVDDSIDFYSHISNKKLLTSRSNPKNTFFAKTSEIIQSNLSEGLIQLFFENHPDGFNVYIANADNKVETFYQLAGSKDELVENVNRFYTSNHQKKTCVNLPHRPANNKFGLPQFYDITYCETNGLSIKPFKSTYQTAEVTIIKHFFEASLT